MSYVIIGGGIAGISAAAAIRQRDASGRITVVADEGQPYYRPLIPKLIDGEKAAADLDWAGDVDALGAEILHGGAASVDTAARQVRLADGQSIPYSKLLIASGARARKPAIPGIEGGGVFTLRTASHALGIRDALRSAKSAVIIGGGFVGVKAAEALTKAGMKITIVEVMPSILRPRLDAEGAEIISRALKARGVDIRASETASEIVRDNGKFTGVRLASGDTVEADFAVVAIGTEPAVGFLKGSGVKVNTGVAVGDTLESSVPGVFAAGDAAEHRDVLTGAQAVSALWSNAAEMGRLAGLNMAGENLKYPGFLAVRNATEVAGVPVVSVGVVGDETLEAVRGGGKRLYRMLAFRGDTIAGAVLMGDLRGAGLYASLIKNRTPLKGRQRELAVSDRLSYADFIN